METLTLNQIILDVTFCLRFPTLLRVVESCCTKFETAQTFSYVKTDATTPNMLGVVASVCA